MERKKIKAVTVTDTADKYVLEDGTVMKRESNGMWHYSRNGQLIERSMYINDIAENHNLDLFPTDRKVICGRCDGKGFNWSRSLAPYKIECSCRQNQI